MHKNKKLIGVVKLNPYLTFFIISQHAAQRFLCKKKNCLSKFIENTQTIFTYLVFDPSKSTERNRKLMPWIICIKLTTTINLTISIITLHSSQSLKFSSQRQKKKSFRRNCHERFVRLIDLYVEKWSENFMIRHTY